MPAEADQTALSMGSNIGSYHPLLWVSAIVFLTTAAHLIANLGAVTALFGRRGPQHGDLQADPRGRRRQASRSTIILSLALHVVSLAALAFGILTATVNISETAPGREGLPSETKPLP